MVTVITGALGGLGSQASKTLASNGQTVIGIGRKAESDPPAGLTEYYGEIDLTDEAQTRCVFEKIFKAHGKVAALVNIAGGFIWQSVDDSDAGSWSDMYRLNVLTTLNASRAARPYLARPSSITNVGAAAARRCGTGMGPYTASKSALARLTEALSEEWKSEGVRVNLVSPTIIDTPANRKDMPNEDFSKWVSPNEIANVIGFLSSDLASGVNGADVLVSGRM